MRNAAAKKRRPRRRGAVTSRAPSNQRAAAPAKICAPRLLEVYMRQRLFRLLDAALRKRVVWIVAPAGTGKTSLVATYLEARSLPALWYNVDARDSDVANLFHYLAMAARLAPRGGAARLPLFSVEHQAGIAAFARGFFEALGAARPAPSAIVIDDYHEVGSELIDEVLREALFALPQGISVIVCSRTEAPSWLARHFAAGEVALLGWSDLRLTNAEIAGLVRLYRPDLRGRQLQTMLPQIVELANGWAAALSLLLQTKHLAPVDPRGMEEFSERLFDYFATEILDKAAPAHRELLLKTSVVPRFTPALAARLTRRTDIGPLLFDLERRSFLTQRLGASGAYRYHPLLRDFLLRRAQTVLGSEAVRELHRRAAEVLVELDQIDEAMEQFETSRDIDAAVALLLRVAPAYIAKGRGRTIEAWISRLPHERIDEDGWLLHWAGASCLAYSPSRSRELFERAFLHFEHAGDAMGLYSCCAGALQAISYEATDYKRYDLWLDRLGALKQEGITCPPAVEPMLATAMVMAFLSRRPEAKEGRRWADEAMRLAMTSDDLAHRVLTAGQLGLRAVFQENVERAATFVETLRESARTSESALPALTLLQSKLTLAWARGDNAACIALAREALDLAARTGVFVWNDHVRATGTAAALASENFEAAREFLDLWRSSAEMGRTFSIGAYYFYSSWEAFLSGDQARARRLIDFVWEGTETLAFPLATLAAQFARAQVLWRDGCREESRECLDCARRGAERASHPFIVYGCDLVESDHEWDEDREHALACLRRGFKIAREGGYHNAFWLGKSTLTRAAVRALEHEIEIEHVRATIAKHRLLPPAVPLCPEGWPFRYRLRALGNFELCDAGAAALRGMPLRLLKAIVAFGARRVRDTQLIDALWPDADGDAGRRVFDTTLHRLRRQIGADDAIRLTDGRVSLDERLCWVDIWALERALLDVERQTEKGAPSTSLDKLGQHLLALYRGPLLADEARDFASGPRSQLAGRFRRAVERLGPVLERVGQHGDAESLYERASRAAPGIQL